MEIKQQQGTAKRVETCEHPNGYRRALGFDKDWKRTGTYCAKCQKVLTRER